MHRHPLTPAVGVSRRALGVAVGIVLAAQAGTIVVVHRMVAAASAQPVAVPDAPAQAAVARARALPGAGPSAPLRRIARASTDADGSAREGSAPHEMRTRPAVRQRWSGRALDDAGEKLAEELGRPPDDLRLFADGGGHVAEGARRDLVAGRDASRKLAEQMGVDPEREDDLAQIVMGFMIRRVASREAFRGKNVTPEAIDDAVRSDALASTEYAFGAEARDPVGAALAALPDMTRDLPSP
jgi:hypothetical protein